MADERRKVVFRWTIVLSLVSLMIVQGACLDQYFYNYHKQKGWKFLVYAYHPAVIFLVWQQIVETLDEDPVQWTEQEEVDGNSATSITLKQLITGYHKMFTWLLYVVPSIFQYVWILSTFVEDIKPSSFFGPRFLKVILCFPSGVFLLLDTVECAVKPELNLELWRVFDLFDTVELLQILIVDRLTSLAINQTTKTSMLVFGSISLFFPAFSLWELQACRKMPSETAGSSVHKGTRLVSRVRIVSKVCQLLFVNIAFLVLRLVLFLDFNLDASIFVAKNVIAITVGVIEIISAYRGKRIKESQKNKNLRGNFQNPAFETTPNLRDRNLAQITATSSSTQTVASDFPNDQPKTIKPEELSTNDDLSRRIPALYRDPEKLLTVPCSSMHGDCISLNSNTSETHPLGCTESVLGDSRVCSPHDTIDGESNQLSSAFQKTARQEQRFLLQNPPRKLESRICLPGVTEAKKSKPTFSALQQNMTTEHEHSKTQTTLRESPVSLVPCSDSKLASSSNIHVKESKPLSPSWQQRTTKRGKRFNAQNLRSEKLASGSDSRVRSHRDTRIEELNHFYPSRLRTTPKQEESLSEMKNFRREKPTARNPRVQFSFNTRGEELNDYNSPSLDQRSADNDTREIHLGFTSSNNGPKRFSEWPETESVIRQHRRHQRKGHDSRHSGRSMLTPAFTVWNTRN